MGRNIALVDDSGVMRAVLRKAISASDVEVEQFLEATNGREGYEIIKSNQGKLDIAFVDLHMPEMGGLEMLQTLHGEGLTKFPIVIVSAEGDREMLEACKRVGARDFIKKPFRPQEVVDMIKKMLPG